jgi:hypothetical protein
MNAPIKSPDEFAEAKRFLLALSPNGPWVLTTIHPTARGTDTMFCDTIEHAMKFIAENNGKRNIYFTAQPVRPVSSKPRLTDATLYEFASVDVDKDAEGVRLSAETKQQAIANLRSNKFCKGVGIPGVPTFLLDSGNGLQALWRLAVGLKPTEENTHSMKEINAFIIKALHGDKGTHNPIQLMRLPGTTNLPSASKRKAGLVPCQAALIMETGKAYPPRSFQREPVLHIIEAQQVIGSGEMTESLDELKPWPLSDSTLRIVEHGRDDEWTGKSCARTALLRRSGSRDSRMTESRRNMKMKRNELWQSMRSPSNGKL